MKHPEFTCGACGSANLRRSHSDSLMDLPKMAMGIYPFRCLDCRERGWINIWLFSKGGNAVCPRCLGLEVTPAPTEGMRLKLSEKAMVTAGARGYRCATCNRRFLSFKRAEPGAAEKEAKQEQTHAGTVSVASAGK